MQKQIIGAVRYKLLPVLDGLGIFRPKLEEIYFTALDATFQFYICFLHPSIESDICGRLINDGLSRVSCHKLFK